MAKLKSLTGFVASVDSIDTRKVAGAAFLIDVYSPNSKDFTRFSFSDVADNRELVFVSVFRDALVHGLPVTVKYLDKDKVLAVKVRSRMYHEEGPVATVTGKVDAISVYEYGMGKGALDVPDLAVVTILPSAGGTKALALNLQRAGKTAKSMQMDILQKAYDEELDVMVTYASVAAASDFDSDVVKLGKTIDLIIGVELRRSKIIKNLKPFDLVLKTFTKK